MITCNTCDSNAKNSIEVDSCKECSHADLIKVTIQRTEYREHTFEIPSGIEKGSDEYDEFINDYDWHDSPIYHANEVEVGISR
jgi:hypothetical protein